MFSRREALRGATAVAAMSAVPATVIAGTDNAEPLLGLWREYQRIRAVGRAIIKRANDAHEAGDLDECSRLEDEGDEIEVELIHGVERQISHTQARTIKGAVIQARLMVDYVGPVGVMVDDQDVHLARNLLAGLEQLAGEVAS